MESSIRTRSNLKCFLELKSLGLGGRCGPVGEEETGLRLAVLISKSGVSTGIELDNKTSLLSKVSVNVVDEFMGRVPGSEAGLAGDTVARIRCQENSGIMTGRADVTF